MKLYTIYDKLAAEAGPIFECKNHAVALRSIRDIVKEEPERYTLYCIGYFGHDPISLDAKDQPEEVVEAIVHVEDKV